AEVETHYYPAWDGEGDADLVIVLRGKYQYRPRPGAVNVLWCMSNPSTVSVAECNAYDAVCVASVKHADLLRRQAAVPVHALLQCTDLEETERAPQGAREGVVFVGNSRGVKRPCVEWAIEYGVDLRIYGRGWRDWDLGRWVV